ncbi:hypothetical protein MLPF_1412 [Mycobacterium lepromatosis]|nr:hypothetical protein MLPF_1412 [Mycobacterium lepromatosis]
MRNSGSSLFDLAEIIVYCSHTPVTHPSDLSSRGVPTLLPVVNCSKK